VATRGQFRIDVGWYWLTLATPHLAWMTGPWSPHMEEWKKPEIKYAVPERFPHAAGTCKEALVFPNKQCRDWHANR